MKKTPPETGRKAIFLDRDGTIMYDRNYVSDPSQVEIIPGAAEALRKAGEMGYLLFLFTNQSGISRGYFDMPTVLRINDRMEELLGLPRPLFAGVCIAPELPEDPQEYRKPSPRFILEMIGKHGLDPKRCYMAGDGPADIMAGVNAGIIPVGIATGKGEHPSLLPEARAHNVKVYDSLLSFVDALR